MQRYYFLSKYARRRGIFVFFYSRGKQRALDWWRDNARNTQMIFGKMNKHFQRKVDVASY